MLQQLIQSVQRGDIVTFVIFAIVASALIVVFERAFLILFVYRINFNKFNQQILKMLNAGELDRAKNFCKSTSKTGVPALVLKAIDAFQIDAFRVRALIGEESISLFPRYRRRLEQIPLLIILCAAVGSFAAVHGIWESFFNAEAIDFSARSYLFSKGVSFALVPLNLALLSIIFMLFPYMLLNSAVQQLEIASEQSLQIVANVLAPATATVIGAGTPAALSPATPIETTAAIESASSSEQPAAAGDEKGNYEDVFNGMERPVLDEEEII